MKLSSAKLCDFGGNSLLIITNDNQETVVKNIGNNKTIKNTGMLYLLSGAVLDGIDLLASNVIQVYPVLHDPRKSPIAGTIYNIGDYLMYRTHDYLKFVLPTLEYVLDVPLSVSTPFTMRYYNSVGYSITTTINGKPLTKFFDLKLKFTHECECEPKQLYGMYKFWNEYVFVGESFINILTGIRKNQVSIFHTDKDEIIAECESDRFAGNIIKFTLRDVIFSETECAVCFEELKERYMAVPCGHLNTCCSCLNTVDQCPVCRAKITMKIKAIL